MNDVPNEPPTWWGRPTSATVHASFDNGLGWLCWPRTGTDDLDFVEGPGDRPRPAPHPNDPNICFNCTRAAIVRWGLLNALGLLFYGERDGAVG